MRKIEPEVYKKLAGKGTTVAVAQRKDSLFELFHENTKLTPLSGRAYTQNILNIGHSAAVQRLIANPYKVYSLMDQVELKTVEPQTELERNIVERRSVRKFSGEPISQTDLSRLLYFSYGRTDKQGSFRAVASGGALYPLELYVAAFNVEGLERGLYHYAPEHHRLDVIRRGDFWDALKQCIWINDIEEPETTSMVIIVTAIFQRTTMKYQDRGYRLILIEAGEVAQNLSLLATSLGLGACLMGGFHDNAVCSLLGIDGVDEAPLLPVVLGRKPSLDLPTKSAGE